jgi:hypothetical protein
MEEPKKWYEDKARLLAQIEQDEHDWTYHTDEAEKAASRLSRTFLALEELYKTKEIAQPDNDMDDDSGEEESLEPGTFTE